MMNAMKRCTRYLVAALFSLTLSLSALAGPRDAEWKAVQDAVKKGLPQTAITNLDTAIQNIDTYRSTLGAYQNRLTYAADNLTSIATNTAASRSRIQDADYAKATTELAKSQIIQQAATAMLAQANQAPQQVLKLLQ